jgi:hypothetical protein
MVSNKAEVHGIQNDKITYGNESKQLQKFRVTGNTLSYGNVSNCVSQRHLYIVQCKGRGASVVD